MAVPQIPIGPRQNAVAVTPGATVYNPPLTLLYIGTTGALTVTLANGGTVTLPNVPVGWINDLAISNVGSATVASNITGFY
jgi:hypothetical protein